MLSVITQGFLSSPFEVLLQGYLPAVVPPPPPVPIISGSGADGAGGSGGRKRRYKIEKPHWDRKYTPRQIRVVEKKDKELQEQSLADRIRQEEDDDAVVMLLLAAAHWN